MKLFLKNFSLVLIAITAQQTYASQFGFICVGKNLHTVTTTERVTFFPSEQDCLIAIENSKDGLICNNGVLYGAGSDQAIIRFKDSPGNSAATQCQNQVNSSRQGFHCSGSQGHELYGTLPGSRTNGPLIASTQQKCSDAVAKAQRGFTCVDSNLMSSGVSHVFAQLRRPQDCRYVVTNGKSLE